MHVRMIRIVDDWRAVKEAARTTVGLEGEGKEPTDSWRKVLLLAEHSPIRLVTFRWIWYDLKSWISTHFVRHNQGITHFVRTQRSDRTGEDRDAKRQDALVAHMAEANAQALINISRKRLCNQASVETRGAWRAVKLEVAKIDPVLASVMVPECIYRGFCPEPKSCGYCGSDAYKEALEAYRRRDIDD